MKYFLLLVIIVLSSFNASADTSDEIRALVNKWDDLHNTQNMVELVDFLDIYAPQVLFYSKNYTDEACYFAKKKLFKSGFSQHIISPVNITYYKSGTVKADFIKRTSLGKMTKEFPCYLLFKEFKGKYRITAESDNVTDQKNDITLNLGEPYIRKEDNSLYKRKDSNLKIIWLSLFAIIVLAASVYFYKKNKTKVSHFSQYEPPGQKTLETPFSRIAPIVNNKASDSTVATNFERNKKKGDDFEKYVVERFNKPCFRLTEWRSDKIHNGVYAASSRLPDLEYHFKTSYTDCYFAVECKWRSSFFEGRIEWSKEYQLENYRRFSQEKQMEVFVLIGIGGQPNQPQAFYIVPLRDINSIHLYQDELQPYYRFARGAFYFDANTSKLT